MRLLLGSGGYRTDARKQAWKDQADDFLRDVSEVLFIPYAQDDLDSYIDFVEKQDFHVGRATKGIHTFDDPIKAIKEAQAIHIGGGNTFRLLKRLQDMNLLQAIREKIQSGIPYLGISAGTNMACPTIQTTNDMPIVMPRDFKALGLIDFQINAHYFSGRFSVQEGDQIVEHAGETREDRIREFHEVHDTPVLGLTEGTALRIEKGQIALTGASPAKLFLPGKEPHVIEPGLVDSI